MKSIVLLSFIVFIVCVSSSFAKDLIVGTSYNARLTWQQKVEYMSFPFQKRVKEVFYSDPAQQLIRGVIVREAYQTDGTVIITSGGVGFSYINLRFKSQRGGSINYSVEIYV